MIASAKQGALLERMRGAALLKVETYEEVEHDHSATRQALLVVVMAAIAAGIGGLAGGLTGLVIGLIFAVVGWAAYAFVAYWIGTTFLKGPNTSATWGELLRTLGFAQSPRLLLVLGVIPAIGPIISLVVVIWTLVTTIVAIRQALDFDTVRAVVTAIIGEVYTLLPAT